LDNETQSAASDIFSQTDALHKVSYLQRKEDFTFGCLISDLLLLGRGSRKVEQLSKP